MSHKDDDRKLDTLDFAEENGENIYQQSLSDSQEDNLAKDNVPDIHIITIEGADHQQFEASNADFDRHFRAFYAGRGYGYEFFEPAYRFGFDTAMVNDYTGDDWSEQENDLKQTWNNANPDTWNLVEDAVKHGWNKALDVMNK